MAILVGGRLAAEGQLSELIAHQVRGWEIVIAGASAAVLERMQARGDVERLLSIGDDRFAIRLPASVTVESVLSGLIAQRVQIVSVTPVKDSLEDLFVRKVAELPKERGLEVARSCE